MNHIRVRALLLAANIALIVCLLAGHARAQGQQKSPTERSGMGNIIHFFSQSVNYSKDPVHPDQIILPLDTAGGNPAVAPQDKLLGYIWESQREAGRTRFEKQEDGKYLARIVWVPESTSDEVPKDFRNPDKTLRERPLVGMIYSSGIEYRDGKWYAPYMYHPNFGITANKGVFFFNKDGELIVRGYKWGFSSTECYKLVRVIP
ncbi:MAG: DUF2147 domain-containing protein [Bacteroidales bacterium]|jgi:hypothetical protein|nr:DUF2147 domain-containing protein [Bacteroidales bacterium]MDD2264292.1 DUF2147 domain-containing protein [Bacteroidales bacterium]MDD2831526.1 DUF2147 domain-containing protein [Bacteroidales bacterium]MDD3208520.1 DUF2147 domain-containing protein [Bacteroidales bacterium]MDD3697067.1 DUF2147 domain-containing protein [Bacteroidales bacterium]